MKNKAEKKNKNREAMATLLDQNFQCSSSMDFTACEE